MRHTFWCRLFFTCFWRILSLESFLGRIVRENFWLNNFECFFSGNFGEAWFFKYSLVEVSFGICFKEISIQGMLGKESPSQIVW